MNLPDNNFTTSAETKDYHDKQQMYRQEARIKFYFVPMINSLQCNASSEQDYSAYASRKYRTLSLDWTCVMYVFTYSIKSLRSESECICILIALHASLQPKRQYKVINFVHLWNHKPILVLGIVSYVSLRGIPHPWLIQQINLTRFTVSWCTKYSYVDHFVLDRHILAHLTALKVCFERKTQMNVLDIST